MSRPRPQTPRDEATLCVSGRPLNVGTGPVVLVDNTCMLEGLIGVLLIIRGKFNGEVNDRESS